jgi:hypothetical protein
MAEQGDALERGCGCLAVAIGLPVLAFVGLVGSCTQALNQSLEEAGPVGRVLLLVVVFAVLAAGIITVVCNQKPGEPLAAPPAEAGPAAHHFLAEGRWLAVLAELRWRPQAEPLVEFSCQRNAVVGGWQDARLVAVVPVSELLRQAETARSGQVGLRVGQRPDEALSFQDAYRLETWILEELAAGRPAPATAEVREDEGPDWTAAYGEMRTYTFHVADVELRGELGDELARWHRDRLEGISATNGQAPAAVAANFKDIVDRYQQGVRRAEEAFGSDGVALQDVLNSLGSACLKAVGRCLVPPSEDGDGPIDPPGQ